MLLVCLLLHGGEIAKTPPSNTLLLAGAGLTATPLPQTTEMSTHTIQRAVISAKQCNGAGHQDMQRGESHFYRYQTNQYNYAGGCQLQQSGRCSG